MMNVSRLLAALSVAAALYAPAAAGAQQAPAPQGPPPSYARPNPNGEETVSGSVQSYDGKYVLHVRDDRGFIDNVQLHQGTVINPTGLRLQPGMRVSVMGYNSGSVFAANEIDTPYQAFGVVPVAPYPYPGVAIGVGFGGYHYWH